MLRNVFFVKGQKTEGMLGVKETILATSIGGVLFAIFSAQPIMLVGVSGTMLIFEQSLYKAGLQWELDLICIIHPIYNYSSAK